MTTRILLFALFTLLISNCASDPCDDPLNIDCPSGDADGDEIINSLDSNPLESCVPPAIELNIIGTWTYGFSKKIEFDEDGSYKDIEGHILNFTAGEEIVERNWRIENEKLLVIQQINSIGQSIVGNFVSESNECDLMTFELGSWTLVLTRI